MVKNIQQALILGISSIFILITGLALLLASWLDASNINSKVLIGANTLMYMLVIISLLLHIKALKNKNPNVFVRSIMATTFIKLMAIMVALFTYVLAAGKNRSLGAVFAGLALYVIYTILEVRAALKLNRLSNGNK